MRLDVLGEPFDQLKVIGSFGLTVVNINAKRRSCEEETMVSGPPTYGGWCLPIAVMDIIERLIACDSSRCLSHYINDVINQYSYFPTGRPLTRVIVYGHMLYVHFGRLSYRFGTSLHIPRVKMDCRCRGCHTDWLVIAVSCRIKRILAAGRNDWRESIHASRAVSGGHLRLKRGAKTLKMRTSLSKDALHFVS